MPFGLGPQRSTLVPSFCTSADVTNVQVPTSCSLSDFCWAMTWPGSKASPNTQTLRTLRRFMAFLLRVFGTFVAPTAAARHAAESGWRRPTTGVRRGPPEHRRAYRAGRYWALTAGAFLRAATHWLPLSSGVVLAARTAPPAAIARATAAIVTSSGASTIAETSYSPYE